MKWYKANSEDFQLIVSVGKGVSEVRLSPRKIEAESPDSLDDITYIKGTIKGNVSTAAIKLMLVDFQKEFDKSVYVNSFLVNGQRKWIAKADRVGLIHSLNVQKRANMTHTELWLNGVCYKVEIDYALNFLDALELYAIECYSVTLQHLREIGKLKTREDILHYDITKGYPPMVPVDYSKISKD